MKIIDISWPITEDITEYKNKNSVKFEHTKKIEKDGARESVVTMCSHTGTHIDSQNHFLKSGKTVDQIDLNRLIGKAKVLDLRFIQEKITKEDLEKFDIRKDDIVLFKTKNSSISLSSQFVPNFVYLEKSGADFLAEKKIKCVGIDYLGIERSQPEHETHKVLLENNIIIIEGLRLEQAIKKEYSFYCLPISFVGLEAAPARVILIDE